MTVRFSRHARRRMKLYGVSANEIEDAIMGSASNERSGGRVYAVKLFAGRFSGYPLKVVCEQEGDDFLVITAYPLKKKFGGDS